MVPTAAARLSSSLRMPVPPSRHPNFDRPRPAIFGGSGTGPVGRQRAGRPTGTVTARHLESRTRIYQTCELQVGEQHHRDTTARFDARTVIEYG